MHLQLLNGLRVIESSAFIAAPLAGMTLAQFGADVIRIDLIGGGIDYARMPRMPGGRSLYWTGLNKGKRSIAIDFRRPEGREIVRALVTAPGDAGGVLLTNIGVPWLGHAELARTRADLISCTIEGNGDGSTAVDYTVNCATGFPLMTGAPGQPVNHVLPAWDIACAYQAAFALAAAVGRRAATGAGAELRLALSDVAFSTLSHLGMLAEAELLGQERPAIGNYLFGAFGRDFVTSDGQRVYVAGISAGQWRSLVKATGTVEALATAAARLSLDFAREEERFEGREAIAAVLQPWFAARSLATVREELDAGGATWGLYQSVPQALRNDARLSAANPVFSDIETPGVGRHLAAGAVVREPGVAGEDTQPAPLLGQNTDEVLAEILGFSSGEIARLHDEGVVADASADPLAGGASEAGRRPWS